MNIFEKGTTFTPVNQCGLRQAMRLKAGSPTWLTLTEEPNSYKLAGTNQNIAYPKQEVIIEVYYPLYEANFIKEVPFTV